MHAVLLDLRLAVRLLVKDRWFTLLAVVALSLGVNANTTVSTFMNAVLVRASRSATLTQPCTWRGARPRAGEDTGVSW